jgi:catechol-2,3-dioxygenase
MNPLQLGHVGIRTTDVDRAVEWYGRALGADVRFANQYATFMSFDDEHHRIVIWDDGETEERPSAAAGIQHVAFMCGDPHGLAEHYERLKRAGIQPRLGANHHFTSSIYYDDPDGNEVEFSCDNFPTKEAANAFMKSEAMAEAMIPPSFGGEFDPEELLRLHREGAPTENLARIGI